MKKNFLTKKGFIRTIGSLMAVSMMLTIAYGNNILADGNGKGEVENGKNAKAKKNYLIVTENSKNHKKLINELDAETIAKEETADSNNNFYVAELSKNEIASLSKKDGVIVEEDIEFVANNTVDKTEEVLEYTSEEVIAIKRANRDKRHAMRKRTYVKPDDYEWNMKAVAANDIKSSDKNKIKTAMLDSGADMVRGLKLADSINLVPGEEELSPLFVDMSGHGTAVASIIAGNTQNDVQGVNPNAELYSIKVLDSQNKAPLSRIIEGIYWCIENEMQIINMSFGSEIYSEALQIAIKEADEAGILMIGAAGNNSKEIEYPAAFPEVMSVAATDTNAEITDFSNKGDNLDIAAPGEKIKVLSFYGGTTVTFGTSIAAPHVTGAASLLRQRDTSKSNDFIRQLLVDSAKNIENSEDCGLLDVEFALENYGKFEKKFAVIINDESKKPIANNTSPKTFEEIEDDENYVTGSWGSSGHIGVITYANWNLTTNEARIMKRGAVYPDGIDPDGFPSGDRISNFHGSTYDAGNPFANYELISRIANKNGDSSTFTNWQAIPGMDSQATYNSIKGNFKSSSVQRMSWSQIVSEINTFYGISSISNTNATKKAFVWGMAIHCLADIFAHNTYRKSDQIPKAIIHDAQAAKFPLPYILGADSMNVVIRMYWAAEDAVEAAVSCFNGSTYGNWMEVDDGLNANPESWFNNSDNFLKLRALDCALANGLPSSGASYNRFAAINKNVLDNATFRIKNLNSGLSLDVWNISTANGTQLEQHVWHGGSWQRFQLKNVGDGCYTIRPTHDLSKAVEVSNGSTANDTPVQTWTIAGDTYPTIRWKVYFGNKKLPNGEDDWGYQIRSQCSGFTSALVIQSASLSAGGKCIQHTYSGTRNERWMFEKL